MKTSTLQRPTPVAFWQREGQLWIEFSDGHTQGFKIAQPDIVGTKLQTRQCPEQSLLEEFSLNGELLPKE